MNVIRPRLKIGLPKHRPFPLFTPPSPSKSLGKRSKELNIDDGFLVNNRQAFRSTKPILQHTRFTKYLPGTHAYRRECIYEAHLLSAALDTSIFTTNTLRLLDTNAPQDSSCTPTALIAQASSPSILPTVGKQVDTASVATQTNVDFYDVANIYNSIYLEMASDFRV